MSLRASIRLAAWAAAMMLAAGTAAAQQPPRASPATRGIQCDRCHASRDFLRGKGGPHGDSALFVPSDLFRETAHDTLRCAQCHENYDDAYPHQATARVRPCSACHADAGTQWATSIHASNAARRGDAPTCVACHGAHQVLATEDRRSPTHPLNVSGLCGRCHGDPRIIAAYFSAPEKATARTAVAHFAQTVHGMALTRDGLVISATCKDCHGAHNVLPADSARSTVNRHNLPHTCGVCHEGIEAPYDSSAHGQAALTGDTTVTGHHAPVCNDCHTAHDIVRANEPRWRLHAVEECGNCHERLVRSYFDTYHGKVTQVGEIAATCADCHTPHSMRPATDTLSSVYGENLVATCGRCHQQANTNFVRYRPHGDPRERGKYPQLFWAWIIMNTLLIGTMAFFLLHSLLWFIRTMIDRKRGVTQHGAHA